MTYTGDETFMVDGKTINLTTNDFWQWAYSDLNNSIVQSMLAKFIVASSIKTVTTRLERSRTGNSYDLLSKNGYKVNVRAAAYIQTLDEEYPDHISFSIAPIKFSNRTASEYETDTLQRNSDVYIFCIYKALTTNETPLNLDLWNFYVLSTKILNKKKPAIKTITLPSLMKMEPVQCDYYGISEAIQKILTV